MVGVSLGWLWNQRCNFLLFFLHPPSLPALSLSPCLILVPSLCGAFNASYHMVSGSNRRCLYVCRDFYRCSNVPQGLWIFIKLMTYTKLNPLSQTHSTPCPFFLMLKPQIGLEPLLEGDRHKPHNACDVMC